MPPLSVADPARVQGSLNPGGISYEHLLSNPISLPAPMLSIRVASVLHREDQWGYLVPVLNRDRLTWSIA